MEELYDEFGNYIGPENEENNVQPTRPTADKMDMDVEKPTNDRQLVSTTGLCIYFSSFYCSGII